MTVDELLTWGESLLGPATAVLAIVVAFWQYKTARQKNKIDLFQRRFAVYTRTVKYVRACWIHEDVPATIAADFRAAVEEATFLFGADVVRALESIDRRGTEISVAKSMIACTPLEDEPKYLHPMRENQ